MKQRYFSPFLLHAAVIDLYCDFAIKVNLQFLVHTKQLKGNTEFIDFEVELFVSRNHRQNKKKRQTANAFRVAGLENGQLNSKNASPQ